jgi:hypothetical protein
MPIGPLPPDKPLPEWRCWIPAIVALPIVLFSMATRGSIVFGSMFSQSSSEPINSTPNKQTKVTP